MNFIIGLLLFNQFTLPYQTRVFVALPSNLLIYARFYEGEFISIDSIISMEDYLGAKRQGHNQKLLLNELKRGIGKQSGYANKGLISTFEIPLPKGGFSEFIGETGKLDVGGYVNISLGGSKSFLSNGRGLAPQPFFPELEMKQEMAINLDGQVGDRMKVYIDHHSERVDETQNKVRVTYLGKEDEIIHEIEGGDTRLSIPPTTYTGDIPAHEGLFGIKSTAKVGPLDLVAIASKEQGQSQEMEIEGAAVAITDTIWSTEYVKRQFFWLGTNDSIITLKVYIDDNNQQNNNDGMTYPGRSYLDVNDDNNPDDTINYETGSWTLKRVSEGDYRFFPLANIVELAKGLSLNYEAMGVYYIKKVRTTGEIDTVGRLPTPLDSTIQLKLICPRFENDTSLVTWKYYQLKNYYQIVSPGAKLDSLRIYYKQPGGRDTDRNEQGIPFIEVLGLDNDRNNLIDEYQTQGYGFDPGRGLLIFPEPKPFASTTLADPEPQIYLNPYDHNYLPKYYLYKKTIEAKAVYTLPHGTKSVRVWLNGMLQDSLTDYHVDYEDQKLEFKKPIPAGAKVRIKVEYSPFFSLSQKSLVGMRGSMKILGDGTLGSSFFYRTESYQRSPTEHVLLGEEPFNRMVYEIDLAVPKKMVFLTKFVDWLPLVETEAESRLNLNFETAYSFSNLNSRGSVHLDDLESGTIIENDISITRTSWHLCSKPIEKDPTNFIHQRLIWFNPLDKNRLQAKDIYEEPLEPNEIADVLQIVFKPEDPLSFGGLTQYIYNENLDECENLELIVKGRGGRIHIDLGQWISEDQLRRNRQGELVGLGTLEDEDHHPRNNTWNQNAEDTGLDRVLGNDDSNIAGDDGNDDYDEEGYTGKINGTEGNRTWDTEDLDRNGNLDVKNWYYSYSLSLDSNQYLVQNAGLKEGWKMFQIPIKDSLAWDTVYGTPDWRNIRFVRIWFDQFSQTETLLIYKLNITGTRWKNCGVRGDSLNPVDSTEIFTITPVNTKTHAYYKSPYPPQKDPLTGVVKSEGGLELRLENIRKGHTCIARRSTEKGDYRPYDTLTFYLKTQHTNPIISLRIGVDTLNYYEYVTEYASGAIGYNKWRLFKVALEKFVDLKKKRPSPNDTIPITEGSYTVVGRPSLFDNRFLEIRIKNQSTTPLTDTIWFNDVKLIAPKSELGRTLRAHGSLNLADLSSFSFAFDESNGRFKRLSESKEISKQGAGRNYAVSSNIALNKLLPSTWHFNIPVALNYRKSTSEPRFSAFNPDVEITGDSAARDREKSTTISRSYTLRISKSNSRNWLLKQTLDRLSFDHDLSQSFSQSAYSCDTSNAKNYRGSYTLDPKLSFRLLNQTFSVLPQNLNFSAFYTDNLVKSYQRRDPDSSYKLTPIQHRKTLNPSFSVAYSPHTILNTGFTASQTRDSVSERRRFGEEVGRNQSFNATLAKSLKIISPTLSFNCGYNEDHRFEIRQTEDYRNASNNVRYGINTAVEIKRMVKFFTQLATKTSDTLLEPGSPLWVAKQIEQFVDFIQTPAVNYSRQRNSHYVNVIGRPDLRYQWGLTDLIPAENLAPNSYPGRGVTDQYGIASGLNYKILSLRFGYSGQVATTYSIASESRTNSESYPDATLTISKVELMPFLKKYVRSSSINSRFNQSFEARYTITGDSLHRDSDSKTMAFNPLLSWQANWVKGISSTANINYTETNSHIYEGAAVNPSRSLSRGGSVSLRYTFSAPKGLNLPFLHGIKFASNLSTNLDLSYTRNTRYERSPENPNSLDLRNPKNDSRIHSLGLGASYNFSASVAGGANFDYSQTTEVNSGHDAKRVSLNFWTRINF